MSKEFECYERRTEMRKVGDLVWQFYQTLK